MIERGFDRAPVDESDASIWWGASEREILEFLRERGATSLREVCEGLGLSEEEATALVAILARKHQVRICQIEPTFDD